MSGPFQPTLGRPPEDDLRAQMVQVGRLLHQREYIDGASGNLTARLGSDLILATPSGISKGFLEPGQLLILDMHGRPAPDQAEAARDLKPTSELQMHLEVYRRRPDAGGVVHAHPAASIALSLAGVSLDDAPIPEAIVLLGRVPTAPYGTPSSAESAAAIRDLIREHDAIILSHHGTLTVGPTLWEAYLRLETLEHTARIIALATLLGGAAPLPPDKVAKLLKLRRDLGLGRQGEGDGEAKPME